MPDDTDAELFTRDELFRLIVEGARDYELFVLAPNGCVASWNIGAERITGYTADEIVGQHFACFSTPEDIARGWPEQLLAQAAAEGHVEDRGWRVRKDGTRFWALVVITALRDPGGRLRGFSKLTRDISEQWQAEQTLRQSEARFATMFQASPAAMTLTRLSDSRFIDVNTSYQRLLGYTRAELINQTASALAIYTDAGQREGILRAIRDHGSARDRELRLRAKSGDFLTVLCSLELLELPEGTCLLTSIVDITERRRAELAAQRAAERLHVVAEASRTFSEGSYDEQALLERIARTTTVALSDGCLIARVFDDQWIRPALVYDSDPALAEIGRTLLGIPLHVDEPSITAQVIRSQQPVLIKHVEPAQLRAATKPEYWALIDQLRISSMLCVPLRLQDTAIGSLTFYRRRSEQPFFDDDDLKLAQDLADRAGLAMYNARLLEDVQRQLAERERAEQALNAERALLARRVAERTADLSVANAELARAARLKDEFLANMSHELRTPLNSILGRSQALQEEIYGPLTPKQAEALQGVEESGRHLLALINDILDLSKIEAGKLDLQSEPLDVDQLCRTSMRMVTQAAQHKRISLSITVDSQVETIMADERHMKQMLVNLLSNAVKFTPEGGNVGLIVQGDRARQAVTFTVHDNGIGIAEDDLPKLFQPFVQIDSRLSRQYEGTGLGLALVARLAEAHGGSVALESTPGQGSRFSVTLPWKPAQASPLRTPDIAGNTASTPAVNHALVIEDSPAAAERITLFLSELGARVNVYTHGSGAVEQAIEMQPDLIVLDVLLPDLLGWEVLRGLKAEPRTQAIPVVVMSVVDEPERARTLGAAAVLLKPIDRETLYQTLRQVLAKNEPPIHTALVIAQHAERLRILLAEDNEPSIELLEYYLQTKGYEVTVARNGGEAVLRAQEAPPHAILMDIQMPGMDGLEAIRRIRADASLQAIPIIAVTALAMPGDRERCLAAGADDYLTKPVNLQALLTTISAHLRI